MSDSNETNIKSDKRDLFVFCPARMSRSSTRMLTHGGSAWRSRFIKDLQRSRPRLCILALRGLAKIGKGSACIPFGR